MITSMCFFVSVLFRNKKKVLQILKEKLFYMPQKRVEPAPSRGGETKHAVSVHVSCSKFIDCKQSYEHV